MILSTIDLRLENAVLINYAIQTIDGRHRFSGDQHEHVAGGERAAHQGCQDLQWNGVRNLPHPSGRKRVYF